MIEELTLRECNFLTLYRPVGQAEMDLIKASDYRSFPPRLAEQPIFYPILEESYAVQVARDWKMRDANSGFAGYVTLFRVSRPYIDKFPVRDVCAQDHHELWVPAEELEEFSRQLFGPIEVIAKFIKPSETRGVSARPARRGLVS